MAFDRIDNKVIAKLAKHLWEHDYQLAQVQWEHQVETPVNPWDTKIFRGTAISLLNLILKENNINSKPKRINKRRQKMNEVVKLAEIIKDFDDFCSATMTENCDTCDCNKCEAEWIIKAGYLPVEEVTLERLSDEEFIACAKSELGDSDVENCAKPWEFGMKVMQATIAKAGRVYRKVE